MLRSLNSGVSAMRQFQDSMDVIGNNIANVNTTGFKSARMDFADALSQNVGSSMQIGTGVGTETITNQFTQGAAAQTGRVTDLAVDGGGFFLVRDTNSGAQYVTRDGVFKVDSSGYLVTSNDMRVQGYSDAGLTTRGDIQINNIGAPGGSLAEVDTFSFDKYGTLTVHLVGGTDFVRGQVLLQNFRNPQALVKEGNNLYSGQSGAGPLTQTEAPGTSGLGYIMPSNLELSNVDLANEFATLIITQRAFQASARIITTSDEILQELVNLKR